MPEQKKVFVRRFREDVAPHSDHPRKSATSADKTLQGEPRNADAAGDNRDTPEGDDSQVRTSRR